MYADLFQMPLKVNGRQFWVAWELEEHHYRITFNDNPNRPMLIIKQDSGGWLDLEDRNHDLAETIGHLIEKDVAVSVK